MKTIFAEATAPGKAGIAIIRISGPLAGMAVEKLTAQPLPLPRRAILRNFADIDRGLLLWFPGPNSFTGENIAELHLHGSRAIVKEVLRFLSGITGLHLAEPGEFTRQAFENDKLDLTAVEGLADLIAAETEQQRKQALRQMEGELGRLYESWRERLLQVMGFFEACLDFADEDIPPDLEQQAISTVRALIEEIAHHLDDDGRGEKIREGFYIAIIGSPNVGKSSLLNRLAKREAAIVSATAGTTRDIIEVHLNIAGYPVILADTAGLRESLDEIENEGIRRALQKAEMADLKLIIFAADHKWDEIVRRRIDVNSLVIINKIDKAEFKELPSLNVPWLAISAKKGEGIEPLWLELERQVLDRLSTSGQPLITQLRHRLALQDALAALQQALLAPLSELTAEDIRLAARALGQITGRVNIEEVLDQIFAQFCIGK